MNDDGCPICEAEPMHCFSRPCEEGDACRCDCDACKRATAAEAEDP